MPSPPECTFLHREIRFCLCHEENLTGSFKALSSHVPKTRRGGRESQDEQMENLNTVFILIATPPPPRLLISSSEEFWGQRQPARIPRWLGLWEGKSTVLGSDQPSVQTPSELWVLHIASYVGTPTLGKQQHPEMLRSHTHSARSASPWSRCGKCTARRCGRSRLRFDTGIPTRSPFHRSPGDILCEKEGQQSQEAIEEKLSSASNVFESEGCWASRERIKIVIQSKLLTTAFVKSQVGALWRKLPEQKVEQFHAWGSLTITCIPGGRLLSSSSFFFKPFTLYWGIADYQFYESFRWTAKGPVIHIYISTLPQTPFPSRLPHNLGQISMCYTVGPCWLSILNTAVCTCPLQTP